jgi:hypothetical protein
MGIPTLCSAFVTRTNLFSMQSNCVVAFREILVSDWMAQMNAKFRVAMALSAGLLMLAAAITLGPHVFAQTGLSLGTVP